MTPASLAERVNITPPLSFVEIRRQKPASFVGQQWVNAHDEWRPVWTCSSQMAFDRGVVDGEERLIWAGRASDFRLFANAASPFIRTSWRITGATRFGVFPANRENVRAPPKKSAEQRDLCFNCRVPIRLTFALAGRRLRRRRRIPGRRGSYSLDLGHNHRAFTIERGKSFGKFGKSGVFIGHRRLRR